MALYVHETGPAEAPAIVFLHGVGASGWMWNKQIADLADYRCLNVDLPGHGKSNQIPWLSLADTADQIAHMIVEMVPGRRAHIVGLSLGGQATLLMLERHAEAVDHALLNGVTVAPMPNRSLLKPQLWLMSAVMKRGWFAGQQAKSLGLGPDDRAALAQGLESMSMQAYRRIMEEVVDYTAPSVLGQVMVPTLVVAGGNESRIIIDAVEAIPRLMPNAQGWLARGLNHGWNVEAPDLFSAMIRAWINDDPLPGRLQKVAGSLRDGSQT